MVFLLETCKARKLRQTLSMFKRSEDGGMVIFTLYVLIGMLLAVGIALDTVRFEHTRATLQHTLDRAILAAADLDQTLDAEEVVEDYFAKAGLSDQLIDVDVKSGVNFKTVTATARAEINTMMIDMIGIDSLSVPASGQADESLEDMEIALVLDNSGSMGPSYGNRMDLLKPAAKEFIDALLPSTTETVVVAEGDEEDDGTAANDAEEEFDDGMTSIAIVPFATHVTVGEDLLDLYKTTDEHDESHCVTFDDAHFDTTALSTNDTLQRVGHFDSATSEWSLDTPTCSTSENREIILWSSDAEDLKAKVDLMSAQGATSIEIGAKWGVTMLDPSAQDVLKTLANNEKVDEELIGRPYAYDRANTRKILVVMSDGENTADYDLKDEYRSGESSLYRYETTSRRYGTQTSYSYYYNRSGTTYDYYSRDDRRWMQEPDGGDDAERMDWQEVWADMSVLRFAYEFPYKARGGSYYDYYYDILETTETSIKNQRTSDICQAAKDAGIIVFTIGMDTYGQGDATLMDCATLPTYFYDVRSTDISNAFNAIALQINHLRLTN